ncbi:MAG: radical SAM protein [Planctomycetota bacterium]
MDSKYAGLRVTLVQMPKWSNQTPPYTLALLTGILRTSGFSVCPKDYEADLYRQIDAEDRALWTEGYSGYWNHAETYEKLLAKYGPLFDAMVDDILNEDPHVVGFSVKTWSLAFSREAARRIKAKRKEVYIIFGGPEMNRPPEEHMIDHPEIDAVCRQEADNSFPSFLRKFMDHGFSPRDEPGFAYRNEDGSIRDCGLIKEAPCVDEIPYVDYSDFDFSKYMEPDSITLVLSRGCIFRCSFCAESPSYLKYRSYSADRIVGELKHVLAQVKPSGPVKVEFNDSLLNGDLDALEGFCDRLISDDALKIEWGGMMALRKQMSDPLIAKLAEAGCVDVFFGMESASPRVLKLMRKTHDPETASRIIKSMHAHKIDVTLSVIVGHPGETEKEFHETLTFLRHHAKLVKHIMMHALAVCAGSQIANHPDRFDVDPASITSSETQAWVGDSGLNTQQIRLDRLFIAQHLLSGKLVDYGGAMDRDKDAYNPLDAVAEENHRNLTALLKVIRNVEVDIDNALPEKEVGWIDSARPAGDQAGIVLSGWAKDPGSSAPATYIILVDGRRRIVAITLVRNARRDVALALGNMATCLYGWELPIRHQEIEAEPDSYLLCAYTPEDNRAYALRGTDLFRSALKSRGSGSEAS